LCRSEQFDALFITIFPAYTALLGPMLVRRFGLPFVLDYQDPWVSAWGTEVGGGTGGTVDLKSRLSRRLATTLEPRVVRSVAAITAVSAGTFEPVLARNPGVRPLTAVIPIGAEPNDFSAFEAAPSTEFFDADDGNIHICHVGTMLPLGQETLRALLEAVGRVRAERPELFQRLRLHFFGTSNQSTSTNVRRVTPLAEALGVADAVDEIPTRIPYSAAVRVQRQATILLALGSSEPHYTASRIFPLLLAMRPTLAVYHERSTVVEILSSVARAPSVRLVTFSDRERAATRVSDICNALVSLVEAPTWREADVNRAGLRMYSADRLAGRLAAVLDDVAKARAAA
jgi:hypothetical protein